jgi:hypothetical protein
MLRTARGLVTIACWLLLMALLCGMSSEAGARPQQETQKPKAPRVWTNEDLQNLKGGINVVGQPDESTPSPLTHADDAADGETTKQLCESDGWADAVAAVVEIQGAQLDSKFWAARLFSNLCTSGIKVDAVSRRITGDYTLENDTKVHLKADFLLHNLPTAADIVAALDERRPFIIAWKGRPYVTNRVDYVNNVYNGVSMYTVSKLYLTNAMTGKPTLFEATAANLKETDGTLQITVTTRK